MLVHINTSCLAGFCFWLDVYCTFGTDNTHHIHNKRQRHIPLPTPIVRRHAEACLSTTRAKHKRARTFAVAARCGGVTPTKFLEDSGRVLNPSSVLPAFVKKIWIGFGISWSNHRILKLERPPPDFPKISAPHRVPYPGKFFSGHTGDR